MDVFDTYVIDADCNEEKKFPRHGRSFYAQADIDSDTSKLYFAPQADGLTEEGTYVFGYEKDGQINTSILRGQDVTWYDYEISVSTPIYEKIIIEEFEKVSFGMGFSSSWQYS